ncbi:SRPBCC domain-containing protein [Streptomyces sp. NPDC013178]|uniref:SRPBCC family protein n=1 Tax=unclassified Streptomyces TaxID=2593676 RepID=UPI0033F52EF4
MEHEVFVPVPVERAQAALADPAQVARAVPGLQQDAGAATEPVAGRLKVRVGGHTITYRGTLRVTAREDGTYAVEGDATEARGTGTVKLSLTLGLRESDDGTALHVEGTASADGRIAELPSDAVDAAVVRLLNRFAENLGTVAAEEEPVREEPVGEKPVRDEPVRDEPVRETPEPGDEPPTTVFQAEIPPSGLDELDGVDDIDDVDDVGDLDDVDGVEEGADVDDFSSAGEPPAEAAHARRTMIGRSAEEVDHAPPRGRYAPVPAPQAVARASTLRWAAPAAAFAVASAIVLGRALRRRR